MDGDVPLVVEVEIREDRSQDLLVYLALAQFAKRPRFSALPAEMQLDVKAFFGSYGTACEQADELLFSAGRVEAVSQACAAAPCLSRAGASGSSIRSSR